MKGNAAQITSVVASLLAANISYHLLMKHTAGSAGPSWFEAGCSDNAGQGGADCAAVLRSPWSYWPPKIEGEPRSTGHLPVSFLGLVYYSVLALWFLGAGRPSPARRWLHLFPLFLVAGGLAGSIFFTYIMFTKLNEWCPWCMVTHVLNAFIAACVVLMWPRRGALVPAGEPSQPAVHPSWRLVMMTAIAVVLVLYGENQLLGRMSAATFEQGYRRCMAAVERLKGDGASLFGLWQSSPQFELVIREDDPARTHANPVDRPLDVIIFSDFACPSCANVAKFLEEKVSPLFAGNLRLIFKHYPMHKECNPQTDSTMHPFACAAARMAEAARSLAGNDGFWRVHDYLFQHQARLKSGKIAPEEIAKLLGLETSRLVASMESVLIAHRVREDAERGKAAGLVGTPAIYIAGRRLDPLGNTDIRLWNHFADNYWNTRELPRPEITKLPRSTATPDTRDPTIAP